MQAYAFKEIRQNAVFNILTACRLRKMNISYQLESRYLSRIYRCCSILYQISMNNLWQKKKQQTNKKTGNYGGITDDLSLSPEVCILHSCNSPIYTEPKKKLSWDFNGTVSTYVYIISFYSYLLLHNNLKSIHQSSFTVWKLSISLDFSISFEEGVDSIFFFGFSNEYAHREHC